MDDLPRTTQEKPATPRQVCQCFGLRTLRRLLGLARWTSLLAMLLAAAFIFTPAGNWLGRQLVDVDPLAQADYIVVLGGETERAVEAANLYRQGWAPKIIISSSGQGVDFETHVAETYGVPRQDLILDHAAGRTADHPDTVSALPGINRQTSRLILVTSLYHTSRSRACFQKAGYAQVCMRAPEWRLYELENMPSGWTARARDLCPKLYEALAWGLYKARGWV